MVFMWERAASSRTAELVRDGVARLTSSAMIDGPHGPGKTVFGLSFQSRYLPPDAILAIDEPV